ncbi:tetratricopeptide (TPR) repeat protein [Haloferula luteola]|uniref:Tetratricopeptide (TPR) repeat protein n=1 Tax=Haloferula luteola TaxID=595692 RepID=A0A840V409_9BACT|nr:tetratricopeptide repeat protein [Haloferula luteola]MBB5350384.1 tetratricopeptide (TPR) repeat protein [Haloferula luteola]
MDSATQNLLQLLRERVQTLLAQKNYDEAVHAASAAVEKAQQTLSGDPDSVDAFVGALEVRAELFRSLQRFQEAKEDYKQAIDQLDSREDRLHQMARLHATYGALHDELGQPERAAELWTTSLDIFEKADPPAPLDVILMANNLAFLMKSQGNLDDAETYFLKALEISHKTLGSDHEETATVSNNLGALYLSSGYYEQAREMHMMALESRRKTLGDHHSDTAQSHNNLALALLETGDRSWARRHFEKSMSIYEDLGRAHLADLEAVSANYCQFLREEGEEGSAARVENLVREIAAG